VLGEYGSGPQDVKAEFIWLNPQVGDGSGPFGGDDGLGGYMPLAVAIGTGTLGQTELAWVHASHMGVPIRYSDASGAEIATPTGYSVPGFPGQSRTFADLYYNRYRDYDSSTGRYIQADPIGLAGGPEPYGYALNNPLRYTDPTGEVAHLLIACALNRICSTAVLVAGGFISDLALQAGSNWWNSRDVFDPNCYDVKQALLSGALSGLGGQALPWLNRLRRGGGAADDAVSYSDDLLHAAQQKYPNKAGRIENHHIEPIYLGGARSGPTARLDAAYHQQITTAFRRQHGYGQGRPLPERMREIMDEVYREFPLPPI
jgi:RHS repeat-associated protein